MYRCVHNINNKKTNQVGYIIVIAQINLVLRLRPRTRSVYYHKCLALCYNYTYSPLFIQSKAYKVM